MITLAHAAKAKGYYVYTLRDPRHESKREEGKCEVFYVGKGKGFRAGKHFVEKHEKKNMFKVNMVNKIREFGFEPILGFVAVGLSEESAFHIERVLIKIYGRRGIDDGGTLTNRTLGGEGCSGRVLSEETKAKISKSHIGLKHTEESRRKIGEVQKGRVLSNEHREKLSNALIGVKKTPEHAANILAGRRDAIEASRGKKHSQEWKDKIGDAHRGKKQSPAQIEKRVEKTMISKAIKRLEKLQADLSLLSKMNEG